MTKTNKIVKTILLSAILIGVTFTLSNIQSAYAQPPLFGLAHTAGPSTLYTINTSTGVATPVGPVGFNRCSGMDFDASGTLFAACNRSSDGINVLITINTSTGAGIEIGTTGSEAFQSAGRFGIISDISFRNSDGVLFGYGGPDGPLFTINTATGAVTQVGPFPTSPVDSGNALAFSATDTLFYMEIDPPVLNTLNPSTGAKTVLGSISIGCCSGTNHRVNAADFDPNSGVLFGSLNVGEGGDRTPIHLVTITTTPSFVATSIGITVDGLDAIAFSSSALETEKFYTETDKDIEAGFFGTVLPFKNGIVDTGNPTQTVKAVVDRNGNIKSYNPGQYYAVTKVTALQDLDEVWITEDDSLCTEVNQPISKMNPKKVPGGAYVALMCPDGTSVDLSSELANSDPPRLLINAAGNVEAHVEDVPEGCMVFLGVKYSPGLKGENVQSIDQPWCENWEFVKAINAAGQEFTDSAHMVLEVILPNDA